MTQNTPFSGVVYHACTSTPLYQSAPDCFLFQLVIRSSPTRETALLAVRETASWTSRMKTTCQLLGGGSRSSRLSKLTTTTFYQQNRQVHVDIIKHDLCAMFLARYCDPWPHALLVCSMIYGVSVSTETLYRRRTVLWIILRSHGWAEQSRREIDRQRAASAPQWEYMNECPPVET